MAETVEAIKVQRCTLIPLLTVPLNPATLPD
jgi:hypothetical protein